MDPDGKDDMDDFRERLFMKLVPLRLRTEWDDSTLPYRGLIEF